MFAEDGELKEFDISKEQIRQAICDPNQNKFFKKEYQEKTNFDNYPRIQVRPLDVNRKTNHQKLLFEMQEIKKNLRQVLIKGIPKANRVAI